MDTFREADFLQFVRERADDLAARGISALGPLYDLCGRRLVRFASMITRQQQDAEDAVQAAMTRLAARPRLLASVERPWPYLMRMVRNEALVVARHGRRMTLVVNLEDMVSHCSVDQLEREDTHRAVFLALRKLPVDQAEVVALKIWETMTFAEIGDVLEISPHTAASRHPGGMKRPERADAPTVCHNVRPRPCYLPLPHVRRLRR